MLVNELEVRYNYSGVKKNWRKIRAKTTRPLRFHQNDFHFQSRFCAEPNHKKDNVKLLRFLYGNEAIALHSIKYIISKIRVLIKIICATILRQINKTIHNLSHQLFSLTCLLVYYLSVGLYSFY